MPTLLLSACTAVLSLVAAAPAPVEDEGHAVIERAIQAHGGFDRLSRLRADRVVNQGALVVNDKETPFTAETTVQLPDRFRNVIHLDGDRKTVFVQVLDGDKVYFTIDGQPQKVDETLATELRETLELNQAVRLVPLLDKTYTLEPLGEVRLDDRPAVGVKATAKGRRDLRLFFDKETGLLVKTEHAIDDGAGKEVVQEEVYSDFQDAQGYRRPMKLAVFRSGKKVMEAQVVEVKYLDKVDASEFAKP